ncbi:MAG TPA: benzoate-CoA ligase family protein [Gemmatimonadales bacterium]|nr:benzoate-CoA ligase family protein [Gemmatimonadales bacterium]
MEIPREYNAATWFVDRHVVEGRGGRLAVIAEDRRLSYAQVAAGANRLGQALRRLGVGQEQRVALLLHDSPEFIWTFWGALKIGAIPIPTNTLLKPRDYEYILRDSRAQVAIVSAPLAGAVAEVRSRTPALRHVVVAGTAASNELPYDALVEAESAELEAAPTTKDDVAFWLYTSGTTGTPKAAVHLHHDMLVCCESFGRHVLELGPDDRTFSVAKLFFAYGLGNALYFPFHVGASTVLYPGRPEPSAVFTLISRERPTVFYAVPTAYAALLAVPDAERRYDLRSLRLCSSAGEPLPKALYQRWLDRFGLEILDGIGSTEMCHTFIANRRGQVRPGSSGTIVPGYDARVVDDDGHEVPVGEVGNLIVKGDSACAGYWNQHERTKQTIQGDWVRTGDKYVRDADGYFWYAGRVDDMIKAGGIWVSPAEVEGALVEHPAVLEAGVVGAADADELVKPLAFVVLGPGHTPSPALEDELKAFVKDRLAAYKYPRWIVFADDLPKTATGKIQRFRLRERAKEALRGKRSPPPPGAGGGTGSAGAALLHEEQRDVVERVGPGGNAEPPRQVEP